MLQSEYTIRDLRGRHSVADSYALSLLPKRDVLWTTLIWTGAGLVPVFVFSGLSLAAVWILDWVMTAIIGIWNPMFVLTGHALAFAACLGLFLLFSADAIKRLFNPVEFGVNFRTQGRGDRYLSVQ